VQHHHIIIFLFYFLLAFIIMRKIRTRLVSLLVPCFIQYYYCISTFAAASCCLYSNSMEIRISGRLTHTSSTPVSINAR